MASAQDNWVVVAHPILEDRLACARDKQTGPERFRQLVGQITMLLAVELLRDLATEPVDLETPVASGRGRALAERITLVPLLRAGLPMAEALLQWLPSADVGHIGIYQDRSSCRPVVYYNKLPPSISRSRVIVLDPMLATGVSCRAACTLLRQAGVRHMRMLCLIASPEGLAAMHQEHPDVVVYTAAIDEGLDETGRIVPGLGDAAARMFGTA